MSPATMPHAALQARLDELKAILLVRDFRLATPEDLAIIREWAGLVAEAQRRLREPREAP